MWIDEPKKTVEMRFGQKGEVDRQAIIAVDECSQSTACLTEGEEERDGVEIVEDAEENLHRKSLER